VSREIESRISCRNRLNWFPKIAGLPLCQNVKWTSPLCLTYRDDGKTCMIVYARGHPPTKKTDWAWACRSPCSGLQKFTVGAAAPATLPRVFLQRVPL
jgi:hypothetical protein